MKTSNPFRLALALAIWAAPLLAQQPPAVQANPAPGCRPRRRGRQLAVAKGTGQFTC